MKRRMRKRILSAVLSTAMLLSSTPVYADVAAEPVDPEVGLCEHHTEHEDWCGYVAPTPGTPCGHEHDESCYSEVLACGLDEEVTATDGNSAHVHDEACYELELDCQHEHDDECGYVEASAGTECEFTCAECIALEELGDEGEEGSSAWVINDRFAVDGLWYKEIGPGKALVYAVDEDSLPSDGSIIVPTEVTKAEGTEDEEDYLVTSIAEGVFKDNDDIVSIDIQFELEALEDEMFAGCKKLTSVTYPDTVTSIGDGAFEGCKALKVVTIPDQIESLGEGVFKDCTKLESVDLGAGISSVPKRTFEGCTSLESIDLSEVTEIGDYAFYNCSNMAGASPSNTFFGDELTRIGSYAFANCFGLADAFLDHVDDCVNCWSNDNEWDICANGVKCIIAVPDSVIEIGVGAFNFDYNDYSYDCICSVTSENVYNLVCMASIEESSVVAVEGDVGYYLGRYVWGENYFTEGDCTYRILEYPSYDENENLVNGIVEVVEIDYIEQMSLSLDSANIYIYVPDVIEKYYDWYDFESYDVIAIADDCKVDVGSSSYGVFLGEKVERIGDNAFKGEENLLEVVFQSPQLEIGDSAFENCTFLQNLEYYEVNDENLAEVSILESESQSNIVTIPEQIHTIGDRAFAGCDYFYEVEIPYSVENMGKEVFAECENLQYVTFASAKYIELNSRMSVDENANDIVMVPEGIFKDCKNLLGVMIPDTVTDIGASAFENCSQFYMLDQYKIYKDEYGDEYWDFVYNENEMIPECTLPSTIKRIGPYAFCGCKQWKTVYAGEHIVSVGTNAFSSGTRFITDSSIVQLMLVASIDNSMIPETSWDGVADVEPGAIVTVDDGAVLTGDIGQNAQVTIPAGSTAAISETVSLAKDAALYVYGSLALDGTIEGPSNGNATICVQNLANVTGEGTIGDNINLITTLTSSMIQPIDEQAYTGKEVKPVPTVTAKFGGQSFTYTEDEDYEISYSNNINVGTATVIVTVEEGGNLLGRTARKNFTIGKATPTVAVGQPTADKTKVTVTATISGGVGSGYDGTVAIQVLQDGKVKLVKNIQMDGSSTSVDYTWNNLYNGEYTVKAIYNGDRYHTSATSKSVDFTINVAGNDAPLGSGGSGGGGGGGGTGGGSIGGQAPAIPDPNTNPNNSEPIDWGVITLDPVKGYVSSNYGIMARDSQDKHSTWKVDEISALIWGGNKDDYWQLQYPNGSVAKGSMSMDENGQPKENYLWEQVNGKWWVLDSKGYAKMGWVFDPNYQAWFYIDVKAGMRTGWIQVDNLWYYLHEVSDGRKGCMYAATRTPDGYYVREDGSWDGKAKQ